MNSYRTGASTNTTAFFSLKDNLHIPFFSLNILFGVPTHLYVIGHIIKGRGKGIVNEIFNLNHSVCEIGTCLCFLGFLMSNIIPNLFPFALFSQGLSMTGRPLFQCLICVERHLAVVHPVTFLKYKHLRYRLICCVTAWILTLGSCLCCLVIYLFSTIPVYSFFFSAQCLIYLPIQLFCLVTVLRALKQLGPGDIKKDREEDNHMKRRVFNLILITTVAMVITYLPNTVSGIISAETGKFNVLFWVPSMLCYVLAGFVQPVLYIHRIGKFCLCSL